MSVSNNIYPHTRPEDERLVQRGQSSFASGMISDVDPVDVPSDGVYDLVNMRATPTGISGRPGTFMWSALKLPYEWEGVTGTIIDDDTIQVLAPFSFDVTMIGYKIGVPGTRTVLFITDVDADNPYIARFSGNLPDNTESISFNLRGPIHASYTDDLTGSSYYMIGTKVFGRLADTDEWLEYFIAEEDKLHSSASTFYKINKFVCLSNMNSILVLNDIEDAQYTWRANTPIPEFKLNRTITGTTDQNVTNSNPRSRYNYAYGFARFKDSYTDSRLNENTFIQRETPSHLHLVEDVDNKDIVPPYYPDGNNTDYTTIEHSKPCGGNTVHTLQVYRGQDDVAKKNIGVFNSIATITIIYDGERFYPPIDFRKLTTWKEVASEMERSFKVNVNDDLRVDYREVYSESDSSTTLYLDVYATNLIEFSFPQDSPFGANTNLLKGYYYYRNPILLDVGESYYSNTIKYLVYPDNARDITHFPIYRSADIYPHTLDLPDVYDPRIQNKPELLGWVDDAPVCKCVDSYLYGNKLIPLGGAFSRLNATDIGNTVTINDKEVELLVYNEDGSFTIDGDYSYERGYAYFGASTYLTAHKFGTTVEVIGDSVFTSSDTGSLIYWDDGSYSLIVGTEVNENNGKINAITADSVERINAAAVIHPTYRVYSDILPDSKLNGYISAFPFNMRFFDTMPNTNIASYGRGILLTAIRDEGILSYSDAIDISRIGYKNSSAQINNTIQDGIKSIVNAHGYFTVTTGNDTYLVNPSQSQSAGNPTLGESYSLMPDPTLNASGIGSTHQTKWAEGLNQGLISVTNEPAVRTYNGMQYGEDLSAGKIKRTELQKIDSVVIVGFSSDSGIYLWGKGAGV